MGILWSLLVAALVCGLVAYLAELLPVAMRPFLRVGAGVAFVIFVIYAITHRSFAVTGIP